MDDSQEKKAALEALSRYEDKIIERCKEDPTEILEALNELKVITEEEMDEATTDSEEYDGIISKFKARVEENPTLFQDFCQKVGTNEKVIVLLTGEQI